MGRIRRRGAAAVVILVGIGLAAPPAGAVMTRNQLGCAGSATIVDDGTEYAGDSESTEVDVPREGSIEWAGSAESVPTGAYSGEISINVGGQKISIDDWGGQRTSKDGDRGTRNMPELAKQIPPGKYRVEGWHTQDGDTCTGYVIVVFSGGLLSTAAGAVTVVGFLLALLALLYSMKVKTQGGVR